jgi:hypothetical protein
MEVEADGSLGHGRANGDGGRPEPPRPQVMSSTMQTSPSCPQEAGRLDNELASSKMAVSSADFAAAAREQRRTARDWGQNTRW